MASNGNNDVDGNGVKQTADGNIYTIIIFRDAIVEVNADHGGEHARAVSSIGYLSIVSTPTHERVRRRRQRQ